MIRKTCRDNLLAIAGAFAKANGSSLEQVSKKYYGNSKFLREFRADRKSVSLSKYDEMVASIRKDWPAGVPWPYTRPAMIERPKIKRGKAVRPAIAGTDTNRLPVADHGKPA